MKRLLCAFLAGLTILACAGCGNGPDVETLSAEDGFVKLTFTADFYSNSGVEWLSATGSTFDIKPNKVKEYAYNTSGSWECSWSMSSIMSVYIDGKQIDSCGSTIVFADDRLEKLDMQIPEAVSTHKRTNDYGINSNESASWMGITWRDYWSVQWWFINEQSNGRQVKPRVVLIQSQEGDPICMYAGSEVSWEICKNLPKTTHIIIDGLDLYVHRANFSVIDSSLF